jgi:hypothetical protein
MVGFTTHHSPTHHSPIRVSLPGKVRIPGIQCATCGQIWVKAARVASVECPISLRRDFPRSPISLPRYRELCDTICSLSKCTPADLSPGTSLLPSSMAIPSLPEADFLWGSLGSVVVSERIKNCFAHARFSGTLLFPITISKVGRRKAKLPAPIPDSGEPDDIMDLANHVPASNVGQYFEVIITSDSHRVRGTEPTAVCAVCGFEQWLPPKQWTMDESLWTGTDVFCLAPTSVIVVTDRVKKRLVEIGATNVRAVQIG